MHVLPYAHMLSTNNSRTAILEWIKFSFININTRRIVANKEFVHALVDRVIHEISRGAQVAKDTAIVKKEEYHSC